MGTSGLVDMHVHLYPDAEAGRVAKETYEIWEYGDDPGVDFAESTGALDEVKTSFGDAGFDQVVVVQLFDAAFERSSALSRMAPGLSLDERADAEASLEVALAQGLIQSNQWITKAAASNELLTAFVCIDPTLLSERQLVDHLTDMADAGATGVKLHPVSQGYHPADSRLDALFGLCCELDLVVLSHSGPGHRSSATARPSEFGAALRAWPELRLVLAHLGGGAWRETEELASAFPQVIFDLSEIVDWVGAPNAPSSTEFEALIRNIGADRIMFGSDFPWYDPSGSAAKVDGLTGLGREERDAILGTTARRALRLPSAK